MVRSFKRIEAKDIHYHGPQIGNEIVNLSTHVLNPSEYSILKKGLNFVPTPKQINHTPFLKAASDFGRRIKLIRHFHYNPIHREPFTPKSNWTPSDDRVPNDISKLISDMENDIRGLPIFPSKQNLNIQEREAIKSLKQNSKLIIKQADKGSATVLMDKENYIFECNRLLSNNNHYQQIDEPRQPELSQKITTILQEMNQQCLISDKQFEYLKPPSNPRPRRFYTLPKIHKPQNSWTVPGLIPPGRPIVSNCNSETEKVCEYIESFLKTKSTDHPSYIKNTNDFISKIKNISIPENSLLVTLDVDSMYTNINNSDGIHAVEESFIEANNPQLPYIKQLLQIILENNDFEFNNKTFLQKSGVSMGIRFAPSFADIFMAKWENDALQKYAHLPLFYGRFLDDIFLIWTHGIEKFNEFLNILNNHHPTINLKATISDTEVDFLDTTVYKPYPSSDKLYTRVYFKPTDTHALLNKTSFHPKSVFKGIIKSQIKRFKMISTTNSDFKNAWSVLYQSLCKRNYSKRWLRQIYYEVLGEMESNERAGLKLSVPGHSNWGFSQCTLRHSCLTCKAADSCQNFQSSNTAHFYPVKGRLWCKSSNLIYLITCSLCDLQYVGQTERELRHRFLEHRRALLNFDESYAVTKHFIEEHPQHYVDPENMPITVIGIEEIPDQGSKERNLKKRLERELFWIDTLVTFRPCGLNDDKWNWIEKRERISLPAIPFIVPYSQIGTKAGEIAKSCFKKIKDEYEWIYQQKPITAYSRHANLQDILVSSKLH